MKLISSGLILGLVFCAPLKLSWADEPKEPTSASLEELYREQAKQLNLAEQELESAHRAGQISEVDYQTSKKNLAETRSYLQNNGKDLGPELAKLQELANPVIMAHNACKELESDPPAYQACLQKSLNITQDQTSG